MGERPQATLATVQVRSISLFSVIGETANDVRNFVEDQCGLDRNRDVVAVAGLVDAWNDCNTRMAVRHQAEAEAHAAALPPPLTGAQDLKSRFKQMHYHLEDKVGPASGTLEQLMEQVESGELRNMSLVQFMSRDDQDTEPLGAVIEKSGAVKVKKGHVESRPPKNGEDFR